MHKPTSDDHAQPQPPPNYNQPTATGFPANYNPSIPHPQSSPPLLSQPPKAKVEWSTGLFDCFSDYKNCCITCWCPCVTFGQVAEIVDKGSTSCGASGALYTLIGCGCLYSCFYRSKMRRQYNLEETPCGDCLVHCCCEPCALCQEFRELENRGYDMVLGWHGNVEQRNPRVAMTPIAPAVENMTR